MKNKRFGKVFRISALGYMVFAMAVVLYIGLTDPTNLAPTVNVLAGVFTILGIGIAIYQFQ